MFGRVSVRREEPESARRETVSSGHFQELCGEHRVSVRVAQPGLNAKFADCAEHCLGAMLRFLVRVPTTREGCGDTSERLPP